MILTSQDQLKNLDNIGAVLIYPSKITTSGLIQSALSNDLVVNCIVDEDPDNAFVGKSLSALGYPTGCYIVINYQSKKDVKDITGAFSNNLQLGYRAAIIVNKSDYTQGELKDLQQYGIVVIDHKDVKNHILTVPEFLTSRSLAMIRDYTNVDISNVGLGAFVGVGKDTSGLGGGRSFGYSTNGQDFYAVITPKGLVFRQIDALRMWRLLKPQQAAQIGDFFNNKVAKEIEAQNESLKSAVATANSAVNAANQAVNDSKVNSDAINAMKSATSSIKSDADALNKSVQEQQAQQKILTDQITSKVSSVDVEKLVNGKGFVTKDLVESSITQASGKINESIINLQGNLQNITADLTGLQSTVKDKADQSQITQLTNVVQSKVSSKDYQTTINQLTNDINAKVAKGDLISQFNMEAGQTLIQSKKLFLDADSVVFSGKAFIPDAAIANLSLDKLTTGHITIPLTDKFGNEIEMGNSGINILSASEPIKYAPWQQDSKDESSFRLNISSSGITFTNQIKYGATSSNENKSDDYQFLNLQPDVLHDPSGASDQVNIPSGMTMYVPVNYSSSMGPESPGGFFALGHETTSEANGTDRSIDIAYVTRPINDWETGLHVNTPLRILPPGADHAIRAAWVSWSNWDGGERYPALVQDGPNWGGIAFPKSGQVTLFDDNGRYYTPDKNTGIGSYNNYGGSNAKNSNVNR